MLPLGSPPMILETPLSTWGRLANTFSAETQTQQGRGRSPGLGPGGLGTEGRGGEGPGPVSAGHLLPPPRGAAATLKERRGRCDFLAHVADQALGATGTPPSPVRSANFGGAPRQGIAAGGPRAAGRPPACARGPVPRRPLAPTSADGPGRAGAHPWAPGHGTY